MQTSEIRKKFIEYFVNHDHEHLPSSSLVPKDDPTLLFTNAGMVQFKEVFLGRETRSYKRATTIQRCLRASGKHNDLENVGYTARHHTFFEMLGNFSFGDYFKRVAIQYAWEFLTSKKWLGIAPEKLWITVHHEDQEAADIWLNEMKIDPKLFSRCGDKDNFWAMGETGPCGYCSEIFYDHGKQFQGDPPGDDAKEGDRYIELWNLVFMQFVRDAQGKLTQLPNPSVDTGMGLERIAAVMQGKHDNYDIDIFAKLIGKAGYLANKWNLNAQQLQQYRVPLKVIADHIRTIIFLFADGVKASNEGRGYVLRHIIRRAVRYMKKIKAKETSLCDFVEPMIDIMNDAYPEFELIKQQVWIKTSLDAEQKLFIETLENGMQLFEEAISKLKTKVIPGEVVFKLYDTYGFPHALTADIAKERGFSIDYSGFEQEMENQRKLSQLKSKFGSGYSDKLDVKGETQFVGYDTLLVEATVISLFKDGMEVSELKSGESGVVVLDITSFYAESGGQVGDVGDIYNETTHFVVEDTKRQGQVFLHYGKVTGGKFAINTKVTAQVSELTRRATMANHSATHLLQAALRQVLGDHVDIMQKGSYVDAKRLRFDFTYSEPINYAQLLDVEHVVNRQIQAAQPAKVEILNIEQAKKQGAIALFDEKYGDKVRVVSMGNFSKELCGGTHVKNTGEIGVFKIIAETGVAAGIRRIEALTAENALQWFEKSEQQLWQINSLLKTNRKTVIEKLQQLVEKYSIQEKELERLKAKLITATSVDLTKQAIDINGIKLLILKLENVEPKILRQNVDQLKTKLGSAAIVLASVQNGKIQLVVGVTKNCIDKVKANELLKYIAAQIDGSGGGRPDMAQGGGTNLAALDRALQSVQGWVEAKVKS